MIADLQRGLAEHVVVKLGEDGQRRLAALHAAVGVSPGDDVYDRIRMARYILTGSEEPPQVDEIRNASGEVVATIVQEQEGYDAIRRDRPTQKEDYPFASGDVLVLGPEIFAGVEEDNPNLPRPDAPGVVINWRGVNFVPQQVDVTEESEGALTGVVPPKPDLVGPDPEFGSEGQTGTDEAVEETPSVADTLKPVREPAPTAGLHWRARRGRED